MQSSYIRNNESYLQQHCGVRHSRVGKNVGRHSVIDVKTTSETLFYFLIYVVL